MIFNYNENSKSAVIYQIYNSLKNRSYIGQTTRCKKRWGEHKKSLLNPNKKSRGSTNKWLKNDFQKCLKSQSNDNFIVFNILEVINTTNLNKIQIQDKLNEREIHWITEFKKDKKTYNFRKGGRGYFEYIPSEKTRQKQSEKMSGVNNPMYGTLGGFYGKTHAKEAIQKIKSSHIGITFSNKHRENISKSKKGKPNGKLGIKHTIETKQKISIAHFGTKRTELSKQKQSNTNKGAGNPNAKLYQNIRLQSPTGEIFTEINCISEFAKKHNLSSLNFIGAVLSGKKISYNGWKLVDKNNIPLKQNLSLKGKRIGKNNPNAKLFTNIKLLSPNGIIYTEVHSIKTFCKEHKIGKRDKFSQLLRGILKEYRGWKLII